MKILAVQLDMAWEDRAANVAKVRAMFDGAEVPAGSLIVLPEMFAAGYTMNVDAADEGDDPIAERLLAELATRFRSCVVGGVVNRGPEGRGRNQALIIGPDGTELGRYAKLYPTTPLGETDHYDRGEDVVVVEHGGFGIAPAICYDLRFADVFRAAVLRGATLYTVIASFPAKRESHWVKLLQARAIEMQAYVVGVNRCGRDPNFEYSGRSMIIDPLGEVIADAGNDEGIASADADPRVVTEYREALPFIDDLVAAAWRSKACASPAD